MWIDQIYWAQSLLKIDLKSCNHILMINYRMFMWMFKCSGKQIIQIRKKILFFCWKNTNNFHGVTRIRFDKINNKDENVQGLKLSSSALKISISLRYEKHSGHQIKTDSKQKHPKFPWNVKIPELFKWIASILPVFVFQLVLQIDLTFRFQQEGQQFYIRLFFYCVCYFTSN